MPTTRRQFLRQMNAAALAALAAHARWVEAASPAGKPVGYGPLRPTADQRGVAVLALPQGFTLTTLSRIGEVFDGGYVPKNLDGMAAFAHAGGAVRLIRNHEVRNKPGIAAGALPCGDYDRAAGGGCTVLDIDASGRLVRQFVGLSGTHVNCAGGYAWRQRAWLSCEETVEGPKQGFNQKHGYVFAVPADIEAEVPAVPLTAMGRFKHEAVCADSEGTVYLTEDAGGSSGSGFYRFLPNDRADLAKGGRLQMLRASAAYLDARQKQRPGVELACDWVTLADPDPDLEAGKPGCFEQGRAAGATQFNRLEGIWLGQDGKTVYFTSTSGGDAKGLDVNADGFVQGYGQIWRYAPTGADSGVLTLHFESPGGSVLDSPDNLCVTPRGGLLLCEDDASPDDNDRHALAAGFANVNRLVGLGREGQPFEFAVNLLNNSELAGACFSPDGSILFVNVFGDGTPGSGMTCAIAGPWQAGPL